MQSKRKRATLTTPSRHDEFRQCNGLRTRCRALVVVAFGLLVMATTLTTSACVRTAECDEHVGCDEAKICYEHRCVDRCQTAADCLEGQSCEPCIDDATRATGGHCLGEEASYCADDPET